LKRLIVIEGIARSPNHHNDRLPERQRSTTTLRSPYSRQKWPHARPPLRTGSDEQGARSPQNLDATG
jgi:hypothetical protein